MVRAEKIIDIDETTNVVALAEAVQSSGEAAVLQRNGKPIAKLVPVKALRKRQIPRVGPTTYDDPLWKLAGIGSSGGSNIAELKHEYIADSIEQHKDR